MHAFLRKRCHINRRCDSATGFLKRLVIALLLSGGTAFLASAQSEADLELLTIAAKAAAQRVAPSIVQIETLGGLEKVDGFLVGTAPTSGIVVDERGYIISSAFNFKHAPSAILVTLDDGIKHPAKIVARDTSRMLVLLKIDSNQPLTVPDSVPQDEVAPGQWAFALGKTFDVQQASISIGIVSATNRIWGRAIQTDAKTSPTNYGGPLVDVRGRVFGVIVPLSTDSSSEVAGADQYDGGIGFAISMADVQRMLPRLIEGQDIAPGLLGITVKQQDLYAQQTPEIAYCPPKSPAAKAGLKKGDRIVQVNDVELTSYAAMKHALGPYNAGDTVRVVAKRGEQRLESLVTLVDKVDPYIIPFLGIVPRRARIVADRDTALADTESAEPLIIGYVYAESAAERAGLQPGDQLLALLDKRPTSVADWRYELALLQPGDTVRLQFTRDGQQRETDAVLQSVPDTVPATFPTAAELLGASADQPPGVGNQAVGETGWNELKLPAEPNTCFVWVPENYEAGFPQGLLIITGLPGKVDQAKIVSRWKSLCEDEHFILLVPQSRDEQGWQREETAIIRKFANRLMQTYAIDKSRVATFGYQVGGAMAYRVALENRDLVRGIATMDAVVPSGVELRGNDPVDRLEFFVLAFEKSRLFARTKANVDALREQLKFPVISNWLKGSFRELQDEEFAQLTGWLKSLDHM